MDSCCAHNACTLGWHGVAIVDCVFFATAAVFCLFSTLPFAVGQVQDAGLIFLSAMASSIAVYTQKHDLGDDAMIATTLVVLSISTTLLGAALIVTGKCVCALLLAELAQT